MIIDILTAGMLSAAAILFTIGAAMKFSEIAEEGEGENE